MVSVNGELGLQIVTGVVFVVVLGVAVPIAWREWGPEFRYRYGDRRGPGMLALFLLSFPVFIVVHFVADRTRRDATDQDPSSPSADHRHHRDP